jgi:hypothetical protein
MRMHSGHREGMALALSIFAMVIIGAMVAGAFFASSQEYRIGRSSLVQARAMAVAEHGQNQIMNAWSQTARNTMPTGQTDISTFTSTGGTARVEVTKLSRWVFSVVSEGTAGSGNQFGARRRTGMLVRLDIPEMNFMGALTSRGPTRLGGSSYIDGNDANPTGWDCPATGAPLPGLAINDEANVTYSGCNNQSCLSGSPKVLEAAAAGDDSTYFDYGNTDWDKLVAQANKIVGTGPYNQIGPRVTGGVCETSHIENWGDPNRLTVCQTFYPIIYAPGNLKLTGGRGQGILLVGGDLEVQGGFEFYGPVIVRGSLSTAGTGGHFNGGVMAANVDLELNTVLGNAVVNYSSCAIATALAGVSNPITVVERAWADWF